nr:hypothetical protein [Tanacetum cinerariifolium]
LGAVELWRIDGSWAGECSRLGLGIESHGGRRDSPKKCMVLRVGKVCVVNEGEDSTDNQRYGGWSSQEEADVSMFHVGSCKVIVLNALGLEESREGDWGGTSSRVVISTRTVIIDPHGIRGYCNRQD